MTFEPIEHEPDEQPQDERDERIAELEAERDHDLREVQALLFGNYGPLRAGIESLFDSRIAELEA